MLERLPQTIHFRLNSAVEITFHKIVDQGERPQFRMGLRGGGIAVEPVHTVALTSPYYLSETPITTSQFSAGWGIDRDDGTISAAPDFPKVENSMLDAVSFCERLNREILQERSDQFAKWAFCLPSEAQWEYASSEDFDSDSAPDVIRHLTEVRLGLPNRFGLYDLKGSVLEMCRDSWDPFAYQKQIAPSNDPVSLNYSHARLFKHFLPDPLEWSDLMSVSGKFYSSGQCAVRGGIWDHMKQQIQPGRYSRSGRPLGDGAKFIGFRPCLMPRTALFQDVLAVVPRFPRIYYSPDGA